MQKKIKESFIKYLAGVFDSDGSICFNFRKDNAGEFKCSRLVLSIKASEATDFKFKMLTTIQENSQMGSIYESGKTSNGNQAKNFNITKHSDVNILLPRIIKHMVIKAKHFETMYKKWNDIKGKILTENEVKELRIFSKISRKNNVGPLKPKNHASWAWTAGYLDGDGSYIIRDAYSKQMKKTYKRLTVSCVAHEEDRIGLDLLKKSFGGRIRQHSKKLPHILIWERNLGPQDSSFALKFLPKLVNHSILKKHKIEQMIHFHRQRLSEKSPTG